MARIDRSYIGKGPVYIRDRANDGGLFPIGNTSVLSLSFDEEKKELKDFTSAGGGNANVLTAISGMTGSMTVHDYSAANMALFLRGTEAGVAAGSVVDEAHSTNGTDGEFIPFDEIIDQATPGLSVTLTNATACAEGVDYSVENNGILVIGAGNIDASGILISYTKDISEVLEALTTAGAEYELYFNGVNEAQGGDLATIRMHRVKFSPAQDLNFIGDEFGEMSADFEVLSDGSIVGAGLSKFMKIQQKTPS